MNQTPHQEQSAETLQNMNEQERNIRSLLDLLFQTGFSRGMFSISHSKTLTGWRKRFSTMEQREKELEEIDKREDQQAKKFVDFTWRQIAPYFQTPKQ